MTGAAVRALATALAVASLASVGASADDDLLNVRLDPEYAGWLIGPISRLATDEEIR